jgi:DNA-directed RNA polymerase specialized sigma24 family protein
VTAATSSPAEREQDERLADLVQREETRLGRFIRRRVPDPWDAEDILQDVFSRLVEANRLLMPIDHVTLALSGGAQPHYRPLPQEDAGAVR